MAVETFLDFLKENNLDIEVVITKQPTHTALQASQTHGVPVCNIVKSLLVKIDNDFLLFLVPGDRRLDLEDLKKRFNSDSVFMANADEVKQITGYSIGGVPPFGHIKKLKTYIEAGFDNNSSLVAAAGSNNSVFKISLKKLKSIVSQ